MHQNSLNQLPQDAITKPLLAWYTTRARALPWRMPPEGFAQGHRPDPYSVWLSEIMLQQTGVATVKDYFEKFLHLWPKLSDLAAAPRDDILAAWAGLGYYSRARNLHKCAQLLRAEHGGAFPETSADLIKLPGIGPYTASAIAAICFDEQVGVVDGNVERVFSRLYRLKKPPALIKAEMRALVQACAPENLPGQFAEACMDLGATICTPTNPKCSICPIKSDCSAFQQGDPANYPKKLPKKVRPERFGHAFVFARQDGAIWLQKRGETGLLAGMREVPGSVWAENAPVEIVPPFKGVWQNAGQITHIFTHFKLTIDVYKLEGHTTIKGIADGEGDWHLPEDFESAALPTVMRKILTRALAGTEIKKGARK